MSFSHSSQEMPIGEIFSNKIDKNEQKAKSEEEQVRTYSNDNVVINNMDALKASVIRFFAKKENVDKFLPIVNRTHPVSLRLLDYFCVNYSRSTQVVYMNDDKYFDVYSSYKYQLKQFSKKMFDPFRRNDKFVLRIENDKFETTLGQLCFFKWCIEHNVLEYVEKHHAAISDDMKKNGKMGDDISALPDRKRRSSRRKSAMTVTATRVPTLPGMDCVIVSFDD